MTELALVIVSYNARDDLEACLAQLHDAPPDVGHTIVVVDNDSSDGTADAIRSGWPRVTLITASANLGYARANNIGIRATESSLVLLLNSDTVPPAGAIDRLVKVLNTRPEVAIAGPRLIDAAGRLEISFGPMLSPFRELWQKCLVGGHRRRLPFVSAFVERRARTERFVDWVSGACLLVRREDADAVGLLDERFFLYTEDVDFCAAARALGRRVLFTPTVEMVHLRGRSGRSDPAARAAAYRQSHLAFYLKHHPVWYPAIRGYHWLRDHLLPR